MNEWISLGRMIYLAVFCGCFYYLIRGFSFRYPRIPSVLVLAVTLYLLYVPRDSTLVNTLLRYAGFSALYTLWSIAVLRIKKSYALYLAVFYTIFMGVWFSCVQVLLSALGLESSIGLIAVTGLCRVSGIVFAKRFFIQLEEERSLAPREIMLSLFPAAACFIANLVLYDYMNTAKADMAADYQALINVLVIFFGFSALLVLLNSERYFQMSRSKDESERARQQLQTQYQLFLKEQENNDRLKALHHDMRNHLHTLEAMSETRETQAYIKELEEQIRALEPLFSTWSPTLDALLTTKKALCDQKGIELTCFIHLTGAEPFSQMELCTLFGNCIDNAIEALTDPRVETPYIHLSGGEVNGNMVIRIENPYAHTLLPRNGGFRTTKEDTVLHGWGLINIRFIVEQKGGTITFQTQGGIFTVTWMAPLSHP